MGETRASPASPTLLALLLPSRRSALEPGSCPEVTGAELTVSEEENPSAGHLMSLFLTCSPVSLNKKHVREGVAAHASLQISGRNPGASLEDQDLVSWFLAQWCCHPCLLIALSSGLDGSEGPGTPSLNRKQSSLHCLSASSQTRQREEHHSAL